MVVVRSVIQRPGVAFGPAIWDRDGGGAHG
jgi:hypothetical protein